MPDYGNRPLAGRTLLVRPAEQADEDKGVDSKASPIGKPCKG